MKRAGVPTAELADEEREWGAVGFRFCRRAVGGRPTTGRRPTTSLLSTHDEFVDKQREAGNETFANAFTFEESARRAARRSRA